MVWCRQSYASPLASTATHPCILPSLSGGGLGSASPTLVGCGLWPKVLDWCPWCLVCPDHRNKSQTCLQVLSLPDLPSPGSWGRMLPTMVWDGLTVQLWGLPVQIVRVGFESSLKIKVFHLQKPEIFSFLRKTAILMP